jgi:hypothetical protein
MTRTFALALSLAACSAPDEHAHIVERCVQAANCATADDPALCERLCTEKPYRRVGNDDGLGPASTVWSCKCWGSCMGLGVTAVGSFRANNEPAALAACFTVLATNCGGAPLDRADGACH